MPGNNSMNTSSLACKGRVRKASKVNGVSNRKKKKKKKISTRKHFLSDPCAMNFRECKILAVLNSEE